MITIYITKGLPASGKSTWARETCEKSNGKIKLVSKDELRLMLDNGHWSNGNEKFVMKVQESIIEASIQKGVDLIIHDTNFGENIDRIRGVALGRAKIVIQDFTDVPVEVCLERDAKRGEKSVGKKVIMDMYNRYVRVVPEKPDYIPDVPDIVICDLDGTLALMNGRGPYDTSGYENDILNMPVAHVLRSVKATPVFVSGRSDAFREQTQNWLDSKGFGGYSLFMRKAGDNRNDAIVKSEIYESEIKGKYNVLFCLDDRDRVVKFWRGVGLTVFQVADGDF